MKFEFTGRFVAKFNERQGVSKSTGKAWNSIEFLCEQQDTQYPQQAVFQLFNDKCDLIEKLSIGTTITVHFNMQASKYNDAYFGKNMVWKIETKGEQKTQSLKKVLESQNQAEDLPENEDDDNLPF